MHAYALRVCARTRMRACLRTAPSLTQHPLRSPAHHRHALLFPFALAHSRLLSPPVARPPLPFLVCFRACSFTNLAPEALQGRARLLDGEALNGPSAWSQRTVARSVWCSDSAQCGPLQRTVRKLVDTWRCDGLTSSGKSWVVEKGPVDGLFICRDFLSPEEVGALRLLFNAHNGWAMYNWGNIGRKSELASVLQRIDFGLPDMTAEGVAAQRSLVQPIGELQQQIISLLEARLRAAFGTVAWGGPCQPSSSRGGGAICRPALAPNMMQFTRIAPGTCLGNHFDRRDKWDEGIASIAWSEAAGTSDERGDRWTLRMQCGPPGPGQKDLTVEMPAGSAYIMGGIAQGRTGVCSMGRVAHEMCSCCWTHGVWNEASQITRESITLRVFTPNWGREGSKSDATLEDTKLPWGPEAASNANAD